MGRKKEGEMEREGNERRGETFKKKFLRTHVATWTCFGEENKSFRACLSSSCEIHRFVRRRKKVEKKRRKKKKEKRKTKEKTKRENKKGKRKKEKGEKKRKIP